MSKHLLLIAAFLGLTGRVAPAQTVHPRTAPEAVTHAAGAKVNVKTKPASSPEVYYCNSGNTVKYHASPNCRGLNRCGATVVPIGLAAAQEQMAPCKWCY